MKLKEDKCPLCGRLVEDYGLCQECISLINKDPAYYYDIEGLDDLIVSSTYSGIMRRLIIDFKFKGKLSYGEIISEIMTEKILDKNLRDQVITYVPMHWKKEGERGYNQSKILAEKIARNLDLSCQDVFEKVIDTKFQVGLKKFDREENLRGAFHVKNYAEEIIIVDDVITTGATISELTKIAKKAGIKKVTALIAATEIA
ncbi:ComF family protein [Peptoniphilus sp. DNF00840]|uniref:ComF family protein n=1 Tax=Peptoniphilus sp. DNF00840 TaxID=1477000 RepID=UPI00078594F6|nr:ComF family protein [Peptoniphilus sp. DNF00840]KXB72131.1 comF family protein [Peptoniphilus sp. DNF00840]